MRNLAVIHFSPIEMYPPVQNLIRLFEKDNQANTITIFTTNGTFKELDLFVSGNASVKIIRLGRSGNGLSFFYRLVGYLSFYLACIFQLVIKRPRKILYYETISSFPAWVYCRIFGLKAELFIHYHEYTSPKEYDTGMQLTKTFHQLEKWIYPRAQWISHTNYYRMQLFEQDLQPIEIVNKRVLPNYPPKAWFKQAKTQINGPVKIVYSGSLSMDTMYTREFANWVLLQNGKVVWHVYSYNITEEAKAFLHALNSTNIILKQGVNYRDLPGILQEYNVGVILYKGHIPNYVYNAPNKFFEYYACGLDVWFPSIMTGALSYETSDSYPKIMAIDFENLLYLNLDKRIDKSGLKNENKQYYCEEVLAPLVAEFCDGKHPC